MTLESREPLDNRPGIGLREDGVPDIDWVPIPAGDVVLQGDAGKQTVGPFAIARYPVTHCQFQAFVDAPDGYRAETWWHDLERQEPVAARWTERNAPRETVSWYEAVAFCRWLGERLNLTLRLPDEWEGEQAATAGDSANVFPWGSDWNPKGEPFRANTFESRLGAATAAGMYPGGASPAEVLDMAGTVLEWCLNKHDSPEVTESGVRDFDRRVLRGGSWYDNQDDARSAFRFRYYPYYRFNNVGFRVLCSSPIVDH